MIMVLTALHGFGMILVLLFTIFLVVFIYQSSQLKKP